MEDVNRTPNLSTRSPETPAAALAPAQAMRTRLQPAHYQMIPARLSLTACLLLALSLPIFAVAPLFYPGYIQTHSGFTPVWNTVALRANLDQVGWLPHVASLFDPLRSDGLLPYYLAAILPLSPVTAVKTVMGLSLALGSVGMFLWLKSWLGRPGALAAALVYVYLPHQLATVYVRGAWGEALFLGLLPWAIWGTTYLAPAPKLLLAPVVAFLWLLLGLSQLGLTIWAFIFAAGLLLVTHFSKSLPPMGAALSGLVIAALINFSAAGLSPAPATFAAHFLYPFQLFSAQWGFGASRPGWADGLSLQLGLAGLSLSLLTIILWQRRLGRRVGRSEPRLLFFSATVLILGFLQSGGAAFIWDTPFVGGRPLSATLTYPWQLLGLTGLGLAVLAGAALWLEARLARLSLFGAVILIIVLGSYNYLTPRYVQAEAYARPEAVLGQTQLLLLDHDFSVVTSGNSAGLELAQTTVPLAVHGPLQAGDTLRFEATWQPLKIFSRDLKLFVHLVDSHNHVMTQFDGHPQQGRYPTSRWIPGELIEDGYDLKLPEEIPAGPYRIFVGFYDEATMERLPVATDSEGRVILNVE